jgi:hypothetical protein
MTTAQPGPNSTLAFREPLHVDAVLRANIVFVVFLMSCTRQAT